SSDVCSSDLLARQLGLHEQVTERHALLALLRKERLERLGRDHALAHQQVSQHALFLHRYSTRSTFTLRAIGVMRTGDSSGRGGASFWPVGGGAAGGGGGTTGA